MDAEQIVRALAAKEPYAFQCYGDCGCTFCGEFAREVDDHAADCLYRLSREWAAANPSVVIATSTAPLFEGGEG